MERISIYIADDHKIFAEGLESILSTEEAFTILGIARNGKQLLNMVQNQVPNIVLLDISMPEMDGEETAKELLENFPQVKILMLTMHNTIDHIAPLIQMGVHGYALKNTGKAELVTAITTLMEKGNYYSSEIAYKLATELRQYDEKQIKLTQRELEVLQLVFEGLSTTEISERIFLSPRTVETHRSNLLAKTSTNNTARLIHYALKNGLIKLPE